MIGKVVESNVNGAKIEILKRLKPHMEISPHEYGWMPTQERPLRLHDPVADIQVRAMQRMLLVAVNPQSYPFFFSSILSQEEENPLFTGPPPIGLVRLFTVKVLPSTTTQAYSPRQSIPLLSSYQWDRETLWHRAFQLLAVCKEVGRIVERWYEEDNPVCCTYPCVCIYIMYCVCM